MEPSIRKIVRGASMLQCLATELPCIRSPTGKAGSYIVYGALYLGGRRLLSLSKFVVHWDRRKLR